MSKFPMLTMSVGQREVPAGFLRLRRARSSSLYVLDPIHRFTSCMRAPPRPIGGMPGCSRASHAEGAWICRGHCQSLGADYPHRQRRLTTPRVSSSLIYCVRMVLTYLSALKKADPQHQLLADLAEKDALFDKAAAKYSAKVSA
jgi:hypothetical protein